MSDYTIDSAPTDMFPALPSDLVDNLMDEYADRKARVEEVSRFTSSGMKIVLRHFIDGNCGDRYRPDVDRVFRLEGAIASLNAAYWSKALSMTDVYDCMPQKRRDEWDESIRKMTTPEFTDEAVRPTIKELLSMRPQFFAERVDGIFRGLSGLHVTNSPEAFGKRMIIDCITSWGTYSSTRQGLIYDLRAGVQVGMTLQPSEIGTPQGGPLSPLLANILLDDLDTELERRGHRFARYADDLLVLVKSERAGQRVKASLTRWLDRKLKLPVNEQKSQVARISDVEFLGFTFRGTKLRWSDTALDDFKHRIRQLTGRSWGVSMGYRLHKLGEYLRGWAGYFGISQYYRPVPGIDDWIRRRIGMCYWKQWRNVRTKVRNLLALGTYKRQAILTAISSKSYWRLSKTLATNSGMTNDWLKQQGLISFRDLWIKAQGYV